ncbi:MAG: prepilin-type N-terminal cleavage/methylation domain-containing protein [Deltaproteobacteria bacterium]|nr:prepilin-type N-terminal cleavage/methylation domain-containing protein [Deltaproteobacteria bacterium]
MSPARTHHASRAGGFTLIELLVVVFLLAVTLALAIPTFQDVSGARLRSAARMIAGAARYVHGESVATRGIFRLELDLDASRYWVAKCVPDPDNRCEWERDSSGLSAIRSLPDGVIFQGVRTTQHDGALRTEGMAQIHFLPRGYVEPAVIHLGREHGEQAFTLVVSPIGGEVEILEGNQDRTLGRGMR